MNRTGYTSKERSFQQETLGFY